MAAIARRFVMPTPNRDIFHWAHQQWRQLLYFLPVA
jgi:hypothetical protein